MTDVSGGWRPPAPRAVRGERVRALARRGAAPLLAAARRRDPRVIAWTPPALGGGNHLYLWLWAHAARGRGERAWVLSQPGMEAWIAMFPALAELTVDRPDVPFRARREEVWNQSYDVFGRPALEAFVDEVLLGSRSFAELVERAAREQPAVTVNVRRGDYYTDPAFAQRYGMDLRAYLTAAFELAGGVPAEATVVSDDPAWCAHTLPQWFPGLTVRTPGRPAGMFSDLARLVAARTLILTNSTFSYWGGYAKERRDAVAGGASGAVIAPTFHVRGIHGGRAWQLSPTWRTVDNAASEVARSVADDGDVGAPRPHRRETEES